MRIAIIGAGELGKLVAHHACNDSEYEIVGYYDDYREGESFNELPLMGKVSNVLTDYTSNKFDKIFIAIGYAQMKSRAHYYEMFKGIVPLANIIHTSSYVDASCKLGEGVFISPGCVLDFGAEMGDNVLLNTGVTVAHHTKVGNSTFIAPGVQMAGLIVIEENCFIGIGATIKDCINIGKNCIVGAGAVVIKNINENSIAIGVPAKETKRS